MDTIYIRRLITLIQKSIECDNDYRVKNYLIELRKSYQGLCPVDKDIILNAITYLKSKGWELQKINNPKDIDRMFIKKNK